MFVIDTVVSTEILAGQLGHGPAPQPARGGAGRGGGTARGDAGPARRRRRVGGAPAGDRHGSAGMRGDHVRALVGARRRAHGAAAARALGDGGERRRRERAARHARGDAPLPALLAHGRAAHVAAPYGDGAVDCAARRPRRPRAGKGPLPRLHQRERLQPLLQRRSRPGNVAPVVHRRRQAVHDVQLGSPLRREGARLPRDSARGDLIGGGLSAHGPPRPQQALDLIGRGRRRFPWRALSW